MALHLTTVLLFQRHTGCIIHIPGKLVPLVINFLKSHLGSEEYSTISRFHKLVTLQWKTSCKNKDTITDVEEEVVPDAISSDEYVSKSSEITAVDSKGGWSDIPLKEIDKQLTSLIGELKKLVEKPHKTADN